MFVVELARRAGGVVRRDGERREGIAAELLGQGRLHVTRRHGARRGRECNPCVLRSTLR